MFILQHAGQASRLLREIAFQIKKPSSLQFCAAAPSLQFVQGQHSSSSHVGSTCRDLPGPSRNASAPSYELRSRFGHELELYSHPDPLRRVIKSGSWAHHAVASTGQHRHCSFAQPPPFPQPPSLSSTCPPKPDEDLRDEADHAELSKQLEQHGPATEKPPLDAFSPLNSDEPHSRESVSQAAIILKHAGMAHLREELEAVSERQATIPYKQLLKLIQEAGVAGSVQEAQRVTDALCTAGVVLRFRAQVYLRPDEVAQSVLSALPDTLNDLENKARSLEADLQPLEEMKQRIDRSAYWRSKAVMWSGFSLLVVQWGVFYWLTWYELSWDVMEPVAYFVSLGTAIGFYLFFLLTNEPFDYRPFQQKLFTRWQQRHLSKINFDKSTFDRLQADLSRYRRYITHFKRV